MDNNHSQPCPHCQLPIKPTDAYTTCPHCGRMYHPECWNVKQCCVEGSFKDIPHVETNTGSPVSPPPPLQNSHLPPIPGRPPAGNELAVHPRAEVVYTKAPLWPRFLASIIDALVAGLPLLPGLLLVQMHVMEDLGGVLTLFAFIWSLYYSYTKDGRPGGQSIGKKLNNLMVVHLPTNSPCTKGRSAIRMLVMQICGAIPYIGGLIEPFMVLISENGRRLGDRIAKTQVISVQDYRP